jgi:hypothetical protein
LTIPSYKKNRLSRGWLFLIFKNLKYAYQKLPHSENTASKGRQKVHREREHGFKNGQFQIGHHKQLTKKRPWRVIASERSVAKKSATWSLNQVLGCKMIIGYLIDNSSSFRILCLISVTHFESTSDFEIFQNLANHRPG